MDLTKGRSITYIFLGYFDTKFISISILGYDFGSRLFINIKGNKYHIPKRMSGVHEILAYRRESIGEDILLIHIFIYFFLFMALLL